MCLSRRATLAGGLALAASSSCAPRARAASQAEDAAILRHALEALHPGLLRYNSQAEMDGHFQLCGTAMAQAATLGETHLAVARLLATIRCGHSILNPANQTGPALSLIADGRRFLPFRFRWIGGKMIVTESLGAHPLLVRGAEVVSLGGVPCGALLRELMALASADGHNDAMRQRRLELRGQEAWELFDIALPLLHPEFFAGASLRARVRDPDSHKYLVELPLLDRAERLAGVSPGVVPHGSAMPAWHLERRADGVSVLAMPSWALFDSTWDFRAALERDLDACAGDRALILDLRGNAGGLDLGDAIVSRLVDRDLPKGTMRRLTRYRRVPADLDRYLTTWDRSFRDWGERAAGPDEAGFYTLTRHDEDTGSGVIKAGGKRLRGRLIVLIDAANSSATFAFAALLKANGLATLVGQTTGGNRRGIDGGAFFFLKLPGTGLEIDVPLIGYFPQGDEPDGGIEPDMAVAVTQADVARGVDPQMERALALAKG